MISFYFSPVKLFHFIFPPSKYFILFFPCQIISFHFSLSNYFILFFPPSKYFILFFPCQIISFHFSPSNYFILFFPVKLFHFIFPRQIISFYFSPSNYFILFFPIKLFHFIFPVKIFHLGHLVAPFSAADVDDDVGVGVLGQGLGDAGLSAAEGPRDGGGAPQHAGEEGVQHPLAGEQRVVGVQLLAHGPGLTNGPHLKTGGRYRINIVKRY